MEEIIKKQKHFPFLSLIYIGSFVMGLLILFFSFDSIAIFSYGPFFLVTVLSSFIQIILLLYLYFKDKYLDLKNKILLISSILVSVIFIVMNILSN
jgi:hypothetical protein